MAACIRWLCGGWTLAAWITSCPASEQQPTVRARGPLVAATAPNPTSTRQPLRLRFVGDVIAGRFASDGFREFRAGAFESKALRHWLQGDLVLANLETPVVSKLPERGPPGTGSYFGAESRMLEPISQLGFTHFGLANNHAEDLGMAGLLETPRLVSSLGLVPIAAARREAPMVRFERISLRGKTIHIAAVTTLMNLERSNYPVHVPYLPVRELASVMTPLIRALPPKELVVVFVHWGQEDEAIPGVFEREAAHAMVDAGADLVVGHHPHVLQTIELYSGVLIAYSLGNFLFDSFAPKRRIGAILALDFENSDFCQVRVSFIPTLAGPAPTFEPELADQASALRALTAIKRRPSLRTERPAWTAAGSHFVADVRRDPCRDQGN